MVCANLRFVLAIFAALIVICSAQMLDGEELAKRGGGRVFHKRGGARAFYPSAYSDFDMLKRAGGRVFGYNLKRGGARAFLPSKRDQQKDDYFQSFGEPYYYGSF